MLETFSDTRVDNPGRRIFDEHERGGIERRLDDDHEFSRQQRPEPVTNHHEYEAKTCMDYLLRGLDGFHSWILHSSIAKQSKA